MATSPSKSASYRLPRNEWPELVAIADQARESMNAFGVAIALTGTKTGEIMCCARSGSGVPDLGLALLPETSLTALCIGRDRQLWLDNVETDGGAHSATVAELRVRSVVVTPIRRADRVAGVLVVCATGAGAFSEMHRVRLQTTANQIAAVLEEKLRPAQERTPKLLPWIESRRLEPVADKVQPPRLPLPDTATRLEQPEREAKAEVEPAGTPLNVTRHNFATLDSVSRQPKKRPLGKVILPSAAALLAIAGATWVYVTTTGSSLSNSPSNTQLSQSAAPVSGHQATLRMDPESLASKMGSTLVLKVMCSLGQGISNVPAQINYDSNILQFVAVSGGEFLSQDGAQVALVHRDDPVTGTLKVNAQRPPGSSGVSGNGTVFTLVFLAKAKGVGTVSLVVPGAGDSQSQTVSAVEAQASVIVN